MSSPIAGPSDAGARLAGLASLAAFLVLAGVDPRIVDDTFITFQYANNLAEHGRLTWWRDGEMVDGFTSLGHVLMLAASIRLGIAPTAANMAINLAAMAAILSAVITSTRPYRLGARVFALGFVAGSAPFVMWYSGGLDGLLWAAALVWLYLAVARVPETGRISAYVCALLLALPLIRPEGLIVAPAVTAWLLLWRLRGVELGAGLWVAIGVVSATVGGLLVWRISVYGHPLPNTYYAKASASRWTEIQAGLDYVHQWITSIGGFALLLSPIALLAGSGAWLRVLFIGGVLGLSIVSGGDSHSHARFLLPIIPLLAMDLAFALDRAPRVPKLTAILVATVYLALQSAIIFGRTGPVQGLRSSVVAIVEGRWPYRTALDEPRIRSRAAAISELDSALAPNVEVVGSDVGALAYFMDRPVLDAAGLNDKELAHRPKPEGVNIKWGFPGLPEIVAQDPEVIFLCFPTLDRWSWEDLAENPQYCDRGAALKVSRARVSAEQLDASYLCASIPSTRTDGHWVNFYVHRNHSDVLTRDDVELSQCVSQVDQACTADVNGR